MANYRGPDGVLYPSKEWYDANVAKVNVPKTTVPKTTVPKTTAVSVTPTTTQNQNIYDQLEQIKQQALALKAQIPSVTDLTPTSSTISIPSGNEDERGIGNAQSTTDYWQTYFENQQKLADQQKAEMEAKTAEFETEKKSWTDKFTSLFGQTQEEKRSAEYEELGFDPTTYFAERKADIAEMESLYESYNAKVAERDNAVAGVEGVGMPQSWMDERKSVITNKYNAELNLMAARINSKAAIIEAKQGNYNEARSLVDEAVSDYTADMKFQYSQFQEFMEMNQEFLDDLGADYKETLNKMDSALLQKIQITEEEKTNIGNMMLQYPNAGIQIGDTLAEAQAKASRWSATQPSEFDLWKQKVDYQAQVDKTTLSDNQKASLVALLAEVPNYPDRETALEDLEANKTSIILQVGQEGYNQLLNEINTRLLPRKTETYIPSNVKAQEAGKVVGEKVGGAGSWIAEPFREVGGDVKSFFSGLFGE
jgi:hypothetical protein